jgi:two-component system sensor histidine kinase TctE
MPKSRTLRRQLLVWLAGPLLVLWSVSTIVDYDIAKRFVNLAYDRALLETALDIGRQVKIINKQIYVDLPDVAVKMLQSQESDRLYYLVTGPNNEFITGEPDLPPPSDLGQDRISYYDDIYRNRAIRVVALRVPVQPGSGKGAVQILVAERVTVRTDFARQIILRMGLPQTLLIFFAAVLVWYAVGRVLAPLSALRREIENRSHRDLSALTEHRAPQEVRPLIRAMNDLLQRLSKTLAAQQRFIADAAHQLRTPVAGIKTQTELAIRESQSGNAEIPLHQLHVATEQTTRLINQLLSLARAEPGTERTHTNERLDLNKLVREAATDWVPRALTRNIDLGFDSPQESAMIEGDAFLLREMLNNLLDNAIRYTQSGGQVTVRIVPDAGKITLSVEDDGPGIPESERDRVFERFYRVLGTGVDGCGLGLAIVREIAERHGAEVALGQRASGSGTVIRIAFPRTA